MHLSVKVTFVAAVAALLLAGCTHQEQKQEPAATRLTPDGPNPGQPFGAVRMPEPSGLSRYRAVGIRGFYRVAKNEDIYAIARRFYGDNRYAHHVLEYNKETIRAARGLKRGLVIALPEFEERSQP